ncbi:glutaredoxin-like protein NrdH [Fructilactobacillus sp. Tb1]|uniref:glutaredoxin-like protein NrdH n=1 Tax=Fructilactobacillus sp. Tb1 TaxID=3422304 RepID=UPI003D2AF5A6
MNKVTVYSKDGCIQCKLTKRELKRDGIEFKEINLDQVKDGNLIREQLKNQGFKATPIVKTEHETWTGFRPEKIKELIKAK